jgi:endonuclease/exonuclease/phosphatase family metal-dependent hydrolase
MRVVTFNVLHGRSLADGRVDPAVIADDVASLGATVLGLQEVDRAQPRSGLVDVTSVAAGALGAGTQSRFAPAVIGTPGETWRPAADGDELRSDEPAYGIALLTNLPVVSWHVLRLAGAPTRAPVAMPSAGRSRVILVRDEPRVVLAAVVEAPAGVMTVATTHLSFVPGWNVWQLRRALRFLRGLPSPRLLLGDLNIPGRLVGAASGWDVLARTPTYPSPDPTVQLDHVLGDGPLPQVVGSQARRMAVSDHRALVVDLGADG